MDWKKFWKKTWYFIWESDSIWSWIINILLAFIIIKFIIYPTLGFVMQTNYPVVAVVSGSMEHKTVNPCINFNQKTNDCINVDERIFSICGKDFNSKQNVDFDFFWDTCNRWYIDNTQIKKDDFSNFKFKNGFNKGDIMVLKGIDPSKINVGDTIVYMARSAPYPIIHRVVDIKNEQNKYTFITKGDHNSVSDSPVDQSQLVGKAIIRVPLLGWIKIGFVKLIGLFMVI